MALHQAMTPEFKAYQQQVVANCKALASALMEMGYDIVTGEDTSWQWDEADPGALHGHHGQGSVGAIPHPLLNLKSSAEVSLQEQHFPNPPCPPNPCLCRGL